MRYAKLIDGEIVFAPSKLVGEETTVYNPTPEMLMAEGYKPVVFTDPPVAPEGYIAVQSWQDEGFEIVQVWHIEEAPDEVGADEAMEILLK